MMTTQGSADRPQLHYPLTSKQEAAVLAELETVLADQRFSSAQSLVRFLRHTITETLAGRTDQLKETRLALDVFARGERFDPRADPIVRVQAGNLRAKLDDYYATQGAADAIRIDFPKGSYVPRFIVTSTLPDELAATEGILAQTAPKRRRRLAALAVTGAAVLISVSAWTWLHDWRAPGPVMALTQLTYEAGSAIWPALSRDGKLLAFSSDRMNDNPHIWIRPVHGGAAVQLTHDGAGDVSPDFSPDGTWIAFRSHRQGGGIYVIPALGGKERRIADHGWFPRFSPDGAWIAYEGEGSTGSAVFTIPSAGGQPREVSTEGIEVVAAPMWTPEGKHLLFQGVPRSAPRTTREYDWYIVPGAGGKPVKVGLREQLRAQGMAGADADARPGDWWADAVVFSLRRGTASNIWKVPINLKTFRIAGPAVRLTTGSALESFPRCSAYGQIVFVNQVQMTGIFSLRLDAKSGRAIGTPEPVIADLPFNYDTTAQRLSSDGTKLALNSNRSGSPEVLIKDLESGKETVLTTNLRPVNAPLISSDGSSLLFGSDDQGGTDIYVTGPGKPFAEKICSRCGTPLDWSGDRRLVLLEGPSRSSLFVWDRTSGTRREWLKYPAQSLQQASLSGDGKWVALMFSPEPGAFVTPLTSTPISRDQLVPLPVAPDMRSLEWSPDGKLLYYFSRLDDHRCLWAQRLEPATRHPAGAPFPVYHFHTNRLSPWGPGVSVGAGRLVFALTEPRSNIWLAAPAGPG